MEFKRNHRRQPDSRIVNLTKGHEVQFWCERWGINFATLQIAVAAVGQSVANIEYWIMFNGYLRSAN